MMGAMTYSGTAASNTTVDGIGAAGSDSPDNIDNLIRALAASDANLVKDLGGFNTVGGSADAITINLADASTISNYTDKLIGFVAASDNATTSPTLNIDTVGAEPIKKAVAGVETALVEGDIQAGAFCLVRWRSTWDSGGGAWELITPDNIVHTTVTAAGATGTVSAQRFAADAQRPTLSFDKSRNATVGSHTVVQSGDLLGSVDFRGSDGTNFIVGAQIYASVDGTPGTNDMPGALFFATTADGGSSTTERLRIKNDGSWLIAAAAGNNGQLVKQVSGATAWGGAPNLVTGVAASGSSVTFSSIPSWVRVIIISFLNVSLTGTDDILVQLGDSGGIENTGYVSSGSDVSATVSSTSGFIINTGAASDTFTGQMFLTSFDSTNNGWASSHTGRISTTNTVHGGGSKNVSSGALTQFQIIPSGANTFDGGAIYVMYL